MCRLRLGHAVTGFVLLCWLASGASWAQAQDDDCAEASGRSVCTAEQRVDGIQRHTETQPLATARKLRVVRKHTSGEIAALHHDATVGTGLPNAHMTYYGGPVVSNAEVVVVFWGSSNMDSNTMSGIGGFYTAVLTSPFMDELTEYNTAGLMGTNQTIGHGTLKGAYTVKLINTKTTLSDADVQAELVAQVTGGGLPAPTADASGNLNTIYMIYFPDGTVISDSSVGTSCVDYCAYHGATDSSHLYNMKDNLYYGVMPDFQAGSGCDVGCGTASAAFDNLTSTSAHELAETITDGQGGLTPNYAAPVAWYDAQQYHGSDHGEVADICNDQAPSAGGYQVQLIWSNLQNECVEAPAQFALSAPGTVTAGVSFNVQVTAQDSRPVLLNSYRGTATFASSDGAATLPGNYTFTAGDAGVHSFSMTLNTAGVQSITAGDTHALGVTGSTTVNVQGATIAVTVGSSPAGAAFSVDGVLYTSSQVLQWLPGSSHSIATITPQSGSPGEQLTFQRWSDSGTISHTVLAPNSPGSFTAYFTAATTLERPGRGSRPSQANPGPVTQRKRVTRRSISGVSRIISEDR